MKTKSIHEEDGNETFALAFDEGEEVVSELTRFAKENDLDAACIAALDAFSGATPDYFDMDRRSTRRSPCTSRSRCSP